MRRLILFLVRCKLGAKKGEWFRFTNQKSDASYSITDDCVFKKINGFITLSDVSINWLLNDECEIKILEEV